jgi:peptide subunit release factor 1 (eRF1)
MYLGMTEAEVKVATEESASELSRRMQDSLLESVIDSGASGGRGCLGIEATTQALRDARVDSLLITRGLRLREPDLADHMVGTAFEQGAAVEELSEVGADRLDSVGEGVGARLRYTV